MQIPKLSIGAPVALASGNLEEIERLGVGLELNVSSDDLEEDRATTLELARAIASSPIDATLHAPYLKLAAGANDRGIAEAVRATLEATCEVVEALKPNHVVVHPGFDEQRYPTPDDEARGTTFCIEQLAWLGERFRSLDTVLAIENVFATPDALAELFERLPKEGVGFCFDVGHAHALSGVAMAEWFSRLGDRIVAHHVHDNHGLWDEHLAVGEGTIDFDRFFEFALGDDTGRRWVIEARSPIAARSSLERIQKRLAGS